MASPGSTWGQATCITWPWHQLDQAQRGRRPRSVRSQLRKWRKTTIWPLETIKNVRLCLKVSPTPLFMYTSSESLHLPASAPDPQIPAQSTPVRRWAQTRCGQEDWHQQEGTMLFPLSQTESWEGCQGAAPHQLDRPVSIPGDQLRPFPSFLFRQKSPGVLAPGRQRVRKRCVLFGGR